MQLIRERGHVRIRALLMSAMQVSDQRGPLVNLHSMSMVLYLDRLHHGRSLLANTGLLQVFYLTHMRRSVVFVLVNWAWNVVNLMVDLSLLLDVWVVTELWRSGTARLELREFLLEFSEFIRAVH